MIKTIFYLLGSFILGMAAFCFLLLVVFSAAGEVISNWYFIVSALLITIISVIFSAIINNIVHDRKYSLNPNDPNRVYLDGKEILTIKEEERRKEEFNKRGNLIGLAIALPLLLLWFLYSIVFVL